MEEARQAIVRATGHEPTVDTLCEAVGLMREDVLLALNARKGVRSLDACVDADGELPLGETLGADCMEAVEKRLLLGSLLKMLPREEMRLIAMRYFARRTQTDIAKEMGNLAGAGLAHGEPHPQAPAAIRRKTVCKYQTLVFELETSVHKFKASVSFSMSTQ